MVLNAAWAKECATALRRGSLDDFLTSQKERAELGIANRWELNSTAEYFATSVLQKLKTLSTNDTVDIPCFVKGVDERLDTVRTIRGPVDIVLFEGWRIGVAHPNFYPFNRVVDTLVFIKVKFKAILKMKYEAVVRDIEKSGKDMYENMVGTSTSSPGTTGACTMIGSCPSRTRRRSPRKGRGAPVLWN